LTTSEGSTTNSLKWVYQEFVGDDCCDAAALFALPINNLCAKSLSSSPLGDSCQGDSGGPMVFNRGTQGSPNWVQVGVVSSGTATSAPLCAAALSHYGVYVSVAEMRDWILDDSRTGGPHTSGGGVSGGTGFEFCFCKGQTVGDTDVDSLIVGDSLTYQDETYTLLNIAHSTDMKFSGYLIGDVCLTSRHIISNSTHIGPVTEFSTTKCGCKGSYGFIFDKDLKVPATSFIKPDGEVADDHFITMSGNYYFVNHLIRFCRFLGICHLAHHVVGITDKLGI
jgi:hypothetical protein